MDKIFGRIDDSHRTDQPKIDSKDRKILGILSLNGRIPLTQLQKQVQLSRDGVNYRIKRLIRKKILLRFIPIIDLKQFGYYTFHTFFMLDERNQAKNEAFIQHLIHLPFTKNVIEYSDIWDIEHVSVAKNVQDFDKKLNSITSKYHDIIYEKEKIKVIKGYNSIHLPYCFFNKPNNVFKKTSHQEKAMQLDKIDRRIISNLIDDGRKPYYEMSNHLGISAEAVSYRIRKLLSANIIRKFSVIINLSALGYHWYSFMIKTKTFNNSYDKKMNRFINEHPYIIRGVKTLGNWDFLLYLVAETPRQFHISIKKFKHTFSAIIRSHDTLLGYKEYVYNPLPPLVLAN